jgi:hypothetical protein
LHTEWVVVEDSMSTLLFRSLAGLMMVAAMSLGFVSAGHADTTTTYNFTNPGSCCSTGTSPFGTVTVVANGAGTDVVTVSMAPNNLIATGSHYAFTFEMATTATISPLSTAMSTAGFNIADNGTSTVDNDPFHGFDYAIDCSLNPTGGCGQTLTFTITGATAFLQNTGNGGPVLFAADIWCGSCTPNTDGTRPTGVVGVPVSAVPGPIVGVGLPGLIAACGGLLAFARRRRNSLGLA